MRQGVSISKKLSYAFGAGILIAAMTSALALWAVMRTQRSTSEALRRVATVARVASGLRSMQLAEDRYMTTGEASDLERFREDWDATDRDGAELRELVEDARTLATVDYMRQLLREFRSQVDAQARAMSGEDASDDQGALRAIVQRKATIASDLDATSANLVDAEVARSAPQLLASYNRLFALFGFVGASMFLGFAFTSWVGRRIVSGLGGIIAEIHAIGLSSRFDRRLSTRWNQEPGDEIGQLARTFNAMADAVAARQEWLEGEMAVARRIQTSILPRDLKVAGLEIAVRMVPATEVGGDYYDVVPVQNGCWLGIGDVAGHGLDAGLIMLMVQSAVTGLIRDRPDASPSRILARVNDVVFDNVHVRLGMHQHTTLTLLQYHDDGRIVFAGAHEEIVIVRARDGRAERIATKGPWVGLVPRIDSHVVEIPLRLNDGDLLVLHTDGLTEAANAKGEMFGGVRLCEHLERLRDAPVDRIRDEVLDAVSGWMHERRDDMTIVVARQGWVRARSGAGPSPVW
jgi:serine phosphatase RsbU (regulator of sigma subunit)/CHASE3 domain sensor protein